MMIRGIGLLLALHKQSCLRHLVSGVGSLVRPQNMSDLTDRVAKTLLASATRSYFKMIDTEKSLQKKMEEAVFKYGVALDHDWRRSNLVFLPSRTSAPHRGTGP